MPRLKRADPFSQGDIKRISELFFKPLVIYKPHSMPLKDWLDSLFHLKEREIVQYEATSRFNMPGLFYKTSQMKIQGLGYRAVRRGSYLLVRKDSREATWDVEFFGGVGDADQVFQLTESEWREILPHLKEVPARGMRGKIQK